MQFKRKAARKPTYSRKRPRTIMRKRTTTYAAKNSLVSITRMITLPSFTVVASGGPYSTPYTFALANVANSGELTSLFQQYRINAVKLTFIPSVTGNDQGNIVNMTSWLYQPRMYTIIDRNGIDSGDLSAETTVQENGKARLIKRPLSPFSIYIKSPGCEAAMNSGLTNNAAATMYKKWLDCNQPNVVHNGCGIFASIPNGTSTAAVVYQVVAKYYMQFKNTK